MSDPRSGFLDQLESDIRGSRLHGRQRNRVVTVAFVTAVLASFAAAVAALFEGVPKEVIAALSVVPGGVGFFLKTMAVDTQATWYWRRAASYAELKRQVVVEGLPVDQASKRLSEIDVALGPRPSPGFYSMSERPGLVPSTGEHR